MVKFLHTNLGLILFTYATFSFQARAENSLLDPSPTTLIELENAIRKVLNDSKTPAAGIAMVKGDSAVWVAGLGLADKKRGIEATENTMFRIGSTSKMFVSLAILKLQEEVG